MLDILNNTADPDFRVRTGTTADLSFCVNLQKEFADKMGFVPRGAIEQRLSGNHYHILSLRGQDAAFVYTLGGTLASVRIIQHAVTRELWLNGYGSVLAAVAALISVRARNPGIRLTVRDDIDTHGFWQKIGARPRHLRFGGKTRKKMLVDYDIPSPSVTDLCDTLFDTDGDLDPRVQLAGDRQLPLFSLSTNRSTPL